MTSWRNYSSPKKLGHKRCREVLEGDVVIQEKIDGSQFSFGNFSGELKMKSRKSYIDPSSPPKMFREVVAHVNRLHAHDKLISGYTYVGECLSIRKHNTVCYEEIPEGHLCLFDIRITEAIYLPYEAVCSHAADLGVGVVPNLFSGDGSKVTPELIDKLMTTKSCLGKEVDIEGIVIKNYTTSQMAKVVSDKFIEMHGGCKVRKGGNKLTLEHLITKIVANIGTKAVWIKAVQHLREEEKLLGEMKDVGNLIREVRGDLDREAIGGQLVDLLWSRLSREVVQGLPEWYRDIINGG